MEHGKSLVITLSHSRRYIDTAARHASFANQLTEICPTMKQMESVDAINSHPCYGETDSEHGLLIGLADND